MRTRVTLAAASVLAALVVNAAPAHAAVTLSSGHVDVIDVNYGSGALSVKVKDYTVSPAVEREPVDVVFSVPAAAKWTVPSGSQWSFLGTAGSTVWRLPQDQISGLLWAGWNTDDIASGALANNSVTFELLSVTGGDFTVYQTSLGSPTPVFHSRTAGPKTKTVSRLAHAHANWTFNAATTYKVTFKVTGTLAGTSTTVSDTETFTFQVSN